MKYFLTALTILLLSSCGPDAFINHKLKAEKVRACTNELTPAKINITSNIYGEHYEFECCLEENFDVKNYTVEKKGDSLFVKLPAANGKTTALYKLVLDIEANPAYRYISINGVGINMKPAERL